MIKLFACGDIINYGNVDGIVCASDLAKLIISSDFAVCNFEAPVTGYGNPQPKSGPHHHQRVETIGGLKKQGFDLLLLANNHIMDFGVHGLNATLEIIEKTGIKALGAGLNAEDAYSPLVQEINGIKVGMINACESQFGMIDYSKRRSAAGYAWINHHQIDKTIISLKTVCDCVIVFSHAGLEHYAIVQKEWRERYRHFCFLGADVVIGSHPHVPQGFEYCGDSLIFYSLGNFYLDAKNYKDKEDRSFAILLEIMKGKRPQFTPVFHYKKNGLVRLAPQGKQVDLERLCSLLGENYMQAHEQMSLDIYEKIRPNLKLPLLPNSLDTNEKSFLRTLKSKLPTIRRTQDNILSQLHILRNEAYYYAVRHALEIIASKEYGEKV